MLGHEVSLSEVVDDCCVGGRPCPGRFLVAEVARAGTLLRILLLDVREL